MTVSLQALRVRFNSLVITFRLRVGLKVGLGSEFGVKVWGLGLVFRVRV